MLALCPGDAVGKRRERPPGKSGGWAGSGQAAGQGAASLSDSNPRVRVDQRHRDRRRDPAEDGLLSLQNEGKETKAMLEDSGDRTQRVVESPQKSVTGEWALLQDVVSYPDSGVAARYRRMGLSVRQGQKLKIRAVSEGLLEEVEEHTATGRLVVLRLTEKGRQAWRSSVKRRR